MALRNWKTVDSKVQAARETADYISEKGRQAGRNKFMKDAAKIRVLCVDDHPVVRDGIEAIINLQPDMMLAGAAATGAEALARFSELRPDVAIVDLQLPDMTGFDLIKKIKAKSPNARTICLTPPESAAPIQPTPEPEPQRYVT